MAWIMVGISHGTTPVGRRYFQKKRVYESVDDVAISIVQSAMGARSMIKMQ